MIHIVRISRAVAMNLPDKPSLTKLRVFLVGMESGTGRRCSVDSHQVLADVRVSGARAVQSVGTDYSGGGRRA